MARQDLLVLVHLQVFFKSKKTWRLVFTSKKSLRALETDRPKSRRCEGGVCRVRQGGGKAHVSYVTLLIVAVLTALVDEAI